MPNAYLLALRNKYDEQQKAITGLQQRAVEEDRALSDEEMRSVTDMGEQLKGLAAQIEDLSEIEQRNAKVAELATAVANPTDDGAGQLSRTAQQGSTQTRSTGNAQTRDRDPGHYRQGGDHSFFADLYRSKAFHDDGAQRRLHEHQRALSTGTEGAGVVPPNWLTSEFEQIASQGRYMANGVRTIPLGDDPRPLTLPKQTGSASTAEQSTENTGVNNSDPGWDSDVDTVSPKPTSGKQVVSRQMIDMSTPAIDQLIYGDLVADYNDKIESKVVNAILAAGPTALGASPRGGTNTAGDPAFDDVALDAAIAVRQNRKLPANVMLMSIRRYGEFLKLKDADGRPLIPNQQSGQAVNVAGVGSVAIDGIVHGLGIVASDAVPDAGDDTDTFAILRPADTLLFESNMLRFRFEEQQGPESVVLGIWGYAATIVRQSGNGVQNVTVDPA